MSGVNEFLSQYYQTGQQAEQSSEDLYKQAQIELFQKLAASENIDLASCSDEQVTALWNAFQNAQVEKTAADEPKEEEKDEKKEKAKEELAEKKAMAEKLAEADILGRTMAHAYVNELQKMAEAEKEAAGYGSSASGAALRGAAAAGAKAKELAGKAKSVLSGPKELAEGLRGRKAVGSELGHHWAVKNSPKGEGPALGKAMAKAHADEKVRSGAKKTLGMAAGAAGLAGAVGAAAHGAGKKKESSAIDELAAESAVIKAAQAGWDLDQACELVGALLENGAEESTKIASFETVEEAIEVRSLELLEQAGYDVTWNG